MLLVSTVLASKRSLDSDDTLLIAVPLTFCLFCVDTLFVYRSYGPASHGGSLLHDL